MSILSEEAVRATNTFLRRYATFPSLDLTSPLIAECHSVEYDGKLVGIGALKLTAEAILVIDPNLSNGYRAKTVEELVLTAIYKGQLRGLDEIHAFLTGPDAVALSKMLKRHFAFEDIIGIPLVMKVR